MLPPSGNPNKSHGIRSKIGVLGPTFGPSLPSWKRKKFPATRNPSFSPIQSWEYSNPGLACDTDYFTRNGPLPILRSVLLNPVAQAMQKGTHPKCSFCSECVHGNADNCCLKDLLNYSGYIFPLQTIKTTSNPEKDNISPLVVTEEKALPPSQLHPPKAKDNIWSLHL